MDHRILAQVAISAVYVTDVLALPVSHLSFWLLTAVFAGASIEAGIGISVYRYLVANSKTAPSIRSASMRVHNLTRWIHA